MRPGASVEQLGSFVETTGVVPELLPVAITALPSSGRPVVARCYPGCSPAFCGCDLVAVDGDDDVETLWVPPSFVRLVDLTATREGLILVGVESTDGGALVAMNLGDAAYVSPTGWSLPAGGLGA